MDFEEGAILGKQPGQMKHGENYAYLGEAA